MQLDPRQLMPPFAGGMIFWSCQSSLPLEIGLKMIVAVAGCGTRTRRYSSWTTADRRATLLPRSRSCCPLMWVWVTVLTWDFASVLATLDPLRSWGSQ